MEFKILKLYRVDSLEAGLGFEQDEGKVSIHWDIKVQGINTPILFTLYNQGEGVFSLSRWQYMFSTGVKVLFPVLSATMR